MTRIALKIEKFDEHLARWPSLNALSHAMRVDHAMVLRVRRGERGVGAAFIAGALTALGARFEDLFEIKPRPEPGNKDAAPGPETGAASQGVANPPTTERQP